MKTTVKKLSQNQVELEVEIPTEEFKNFIKKTTLELGKNLEVKGFRKGTIPPEMIEKRVGSEKILRTAAQEAIRQNYSKVLEKEKIEAVSEPEITISKLAKGSPFGFKVKIWTIPEIRLPDYRRIASQVQKKEVRVTEEEIKRLREEKERRERERLRQEILDQIAQKTEVEIPQILIEKEKKRMLENLKKGVLQVLRMSFEDYLKKLKKTEKELLDSFSAEAQRRIKNSLVLREIGGKEKILVTDQEVKKELQKIGQGAPKTEKPLDPEQLKDYTKEVLKNEKIFQFLENLIEK
jgi:FKBP-type peptidyl-prolyl cis-trans isomerase (trigger factor)